MNSLKVCLISAINENKDIPSKVKADVIENTFARFKNKFFDRSFCEDCKENEKFNTYYTNLALNYNALIQSSVDEIESERAHRHNNTLTTRPTPSLLSLLIEKDIENSTSPQCIADLEPSDENEDSNSYSNMPPHKRLKSSNSDSSSSSSSSSSGNSSSSEGEKFYSRTRKEDALSNRSVFIGDGKTVASPSPSTVDDESDDSCDIHKNNFGCDTVIDVHKNNLAFQSMAHIDTYIHHGNPFLATIKGVSILKLPDKGLIKKHRYCPTHFRLRML
jgi:hypothetical protein